NIFLDRSLQTPNLPCVRTSYSRRNFRRGRRHSDCSRRWIDGSPERPGTPCGDGIDDGADAASTAQGTRRGSPELSTARIRSGSLAGPPRELASGTEQPVADLVAVGH